MSDEILDLDSPSEDVDLHIEKMLSYAEKNFRGRAALPVAEGPSSFPSRASMEKRCPTCPFNADVKPFRGYLEGLQKLLPSWLHDSALIRDEVDAALSVLVVLPTFACHYDVMADNCANMKSIEGLQSMRVCAGSVLALEGSADDVPAVKRAKRLLAAKKGPLRKERRERLVRLFGLAFQQMTNGVARAFPESDAGKLMLRWEKWLGAG